MKDAIKKQIALLVDKNLELDRIYKFESPESRKKRWISAVKSLIEAIDILDPGNTD